MRHGLPYQWLRCKRTMPMVHHDLYVQCAVNACERCEGRRVIEVGCGDGWNCPYLIMAGFDVVGTDFNADAIRWATKLVPDAMFFASDLTDEQIPEDLERNFDIVLAVEVIEHIEPAKCQEAMQTMRSLSRRGGSLVVTVPSVNMPNNNPEHYRHFSPETLSDTIEEGSFWRIREIVGCGDAGYVRRYRDFIRPLIDNRLFHARAIESALFRWYQKSKQRTSTSKCLNLVAIADAA